MDFEIVFPHMIQGKGTHFLCFVFFENENGNHSWDTSVPSARSSFERPTSVPVFFFFFFFAGELVTACLLVRAFGTRILL